MLVSTRVIQRFVVGTLATVGLLAALASLAADLVRWQVDPGAWSGLSPLLFDIALGLAWPAFATLGLLIVWLSPRQSGAMFGVLFLAIYALWGLAGKHLDPQAGWFRPLTMGFDFLFHTSAIRFAQLFPRPLERPDVLALGKGPVTRILAAPFALLLEPRVFWPAAVLGEGMALVPGWRWLYLIHVLFVSFVATLYFYAGYRRGSAAERQRIFWLMEAAVVFVVCELAYHSLNAFHALQIFDIDRAFWASWLHVAEIWLTLLCIALAIFHKGAFDSRLVVRRTSIAGAAGASGVVIFITMEEAITEALEGIFGFQSSMGTIIGGVAVALLLRPISAWMDRRLGGEGKQRGARTR